VGEVIVERHLTIVSCGSTSAGVCGDFYLCCLSLR
jgi:hypothetical protein